MNRNLFCITAVFFGGSFLWLPGAGRCAAHSNGGVAVGARFSDPGEDAQSAGLRFITGTVLDPSGAAIPAAQVMLLSGDGKELARVSSGEDGGFQFEKLAAGTYKIQARAPGFRDTAVELKVGSRAPSPLRVVLPIDVRNEVVNVTGGDVSLVVNTDVSENQNANNLDRSALGRAGS